MIRKVAFLALAAIALFAVQVVDCTSLLSASQQKMSCCGSMPCHPGHGPHQCCKAKDSPQPPTVLTQESEVRGIPCAFAATLASAAEIAAAPIAYSEFEAPQHSPPELYTLHSSLRI